MFLSENTWSKTTFVSAKHLEECEVAWIDVNRRRIDSTQGKVWATWIWSVNASTLEGCIDCGRRLRTFMIKKEEVQRNLLVAFHYRSCTNIWAKIFLLSALLKSKSRSSVARSNSFCLCCAGLWSQGPRLSLRALFIDLRRTMRTTRSGMLNIFFSKKLMFEVLKLLWMCHDLRKHVALGHRCRCWSPQGGMSLSSVPQLAHLYAQTDKAQEPARKIWTSFFLHGDGSTVCQFTN